jgi:hypothetical protein
LARKSVGAVKKVMVAGNASTVMMGGCCDARNALSPYILEMLCIALRYVHPHSYNSFLTLLRNGMVSFLRSHPFAIQAFTFSLVMEVENASLQHQDPTHSL